MLTLENFFGDLKEHAEAVSKGADSAETTYRMFLATKPIFEVSACCHAEVVQVGIHTVCEYCGEYCRVI